MLYMPLSTPTKYFNMGEWSHHDGARHWQSVSNTIHALLEDYGVVGFMWKCDEHRDEAKHMGASEW
jgi:hypothetical protein